MGREQKKSHDLNPFPVQPDPIPSLHSEDEALFVLKGRSVKGRLLVLVHAERGGRIRIITSRLATKMERLGYDKGSDLRLTHVVVK